MQAQILTLLKSRSNATGWLICSSGHDLQVVRSLCHQVIVLRQGEVVEQETAGRFSRRPQSTLYRQPLQLAD